MTTRKTTSDPWGTPVNLGPTLNSQANEHAPSISAEVLGKVERQAVGGAFRPGGLGSTDIWVTTRKTMADPWGSPVNLGPTVNSSGIEISPCISTDGLTLYFCSSRPEVYGITDLWMTTRKTTGDPWSTPLNLGSAVNSPDWEFDPHISSDGCTLYFASNRPDGSGDSDLWQVSLKAHGAKE